MKRLGVTDLLSVSACGSLNEDLPPGAFVRIDQFIDRTVARQKSFFGSGCVAHVSMAEPVCNPLGRLSIEAGKAIDLPIHDSGTYLAMEGPQFSPKAEAELYRSWGCDVVGMTNMPEAKLAREAEICYASIAMVTDYDCWHSEHGHVEVADVIRILQDNAEKARQLVHAVAKRLNERPAACEQGCDRALEAAIMTAPDKRDPELVAKLDAVAGRMLG
ncbi:MAG: S-methyl-5'-thioadenosine phosphorylase, partial [Alphaproteobacteria bacterium]|nr:S-methyl-5'-thioadenosine phosphorylase [Alphaproteobacteria bacterium]